ncbi:hypothetical protein ACFQGX_03640 [Nonomuraea dietziae]|uniref:hypothetical protein n=1 Tax=Nonomuraea dietziae TaxID=65515 RepID=UPI003605E17A
MAEGLGHLQELADVVELGRDGQADAEHAETLAARRDRQVERAVRFLPLRLLGGEGAARVAGVDTDLVVAENGRVEHGSQRDQRVVGQQQFRALHGRMSDERVADHLRQRVRRGRVESLVDGAQAIADSHVLPRHMGGCCL